MRIRLLIPALVVLLAGSVAAQHSHHGHMDHGAGAADTREFVSFPPELVVHTMANMRDHLLALQEISDSLANDQPDKAARIAEQRLGMSSLPLHGADEVAAFMPKGMQDAGTTMHRAASRFAIEAQNVGVTGELKPALGALAEVMRACAGCHAGYRLK
ncbi:MAG: hypothetical protein KGM94_01620 [Bradyrhizobium sp.]|nr:hypothetical protein [Bradyrhizobium sp.]